jgi:signal peptidase II
MFWSVTILVFVLDLAVKGLAQARLPYGEAVPLIPGVLWLRLVYNKGAAFGMLQGKVWLLMIIAVGFLGGLIWWMRTQTLSRFERIACGLIAGGAISNFYDRALLGHVVDYIDPGWWPVFNIADSCICIGVGLLILFEFRKGKEI